MSPPDPARPTLPPPAPQTPPAPTAAATPKGLLRRHGTDLLAGLSVAGVLLPEAVAYAAIAGVEPLHALIAALVGLCIYPLLGSSRFAIVAPTSSAAAVFASAVAIGGPAMGYALVGLTGLMFLAAGLLRAGFLGAFISRPVLRGFAWALAVTIVIKQLPHMAGVAGHGSLPLPLLWHLLQAHAEWHQASLALGFGALALWLALRQVAQRWVFMPPSLLVLGLGIALSAGLGDQGVKLVGDIDWQGLNWQLPELRTDQWLRAAEIAPALLLILFAESWGSVRSLALQHGDTVRANRELMALGAANLVSGLVQGLPVGAGFSAAMASQSAGGRSQWAGIGAALALALLLWLARPWLALMPVPVLAAVVAGILSHNLWPKALIATLRLGSDAWLALVAGAGVLCFGVLFGMLLAVALSLLLALRRFAQPLVSELGQLPGTRDYLDCERHPETRVQAGILVMRPEEPLFFANAEQVFSLVRQRTGQRQARVVVLSLEMSDDFDTTVMESLAEFTTTLSQNGVALLLARVKDKPREALLRQGLADGRHGHPTLYWSVDDAMKGAQRLNARSAGPGALAT